MNMAINETVIIYPNPTAGIINLKDFKNPADIKIYGTNGQLLKSFQEVNNKIDFSDLPTGVYILKFISDDKTVIWKVVKE